MAWWVGVVRKSASEAAIEIGCRRFVCVYVSVLNFWVLAWFCWTMRWISNRKVQVPCLCKPCLVAFGPLSS
jgi:hypothetical protein